MNRAHWVRTLSGLACAGLIGIFFLMGISESESSVSWDLKAQRACGLPAAGHRIDTAVVETLDLSGRGWQITYAGSNSDGVSVALNVNSSVSKTLDLFHQWAVDNALEIIAEDNEGFEAELFVGDETRYDVIRMRAAPKCPNASRVSVFSNN